MYKGWVFDYMFIVLLIFVGCDSYWGIENHCGDGEGGYVWECECEGILIKEVEPISSDDKNRWFHCCNMEQDSCWYRVLHDE